MKRIIIDLDNTLCRQGPDGYMDAEPVQDVVEAVRRYKHDGFDIVIHTSRNMRTFSGNVGKINAFTLPAIVEWLDRHRIPYDEIVVGKPWCGYEGFYVDDRAIRPKEFASLTFSEIKAMLDLES